MAKKRETEINRGNEATRKQANNIKRNERERERKKHAYT